MPVRLVTHELQNIEKSQREVQSIKQGANDAESKRKELELLLLQAQEAAEQRERELMEQQNLEQDIQKEGEVAGG